MTGPMYCVVCDMAFHDGDSVVAAGNATIQELGRYDDGPYLDDDQWLGVFCDDCWTRAFNLPASPDQCPNCSCKDHIRSSYCDGCVEILCEDCWAEHNEDADDHTMTRTKTVLGRHREVGICKQ